MAQGPVWGGQIPLSSYPPHSPYALLFRPLTPTFSTSDPLFADGRSEIVDRKPLRVCSLPVTCPDPVGALPNFQIPPFPKVKTPRS